MAIVLARERMNSEGRNVACIGLIDRGSKCTAFCPFVAVAEGRPVEEPRGGRVRRILPKGSVNTIATADEFILKDGELTGGAGDGEPTGGRRAMTMRASRSFPFAFSPLPSCGGNRDGLLCATPLGITAVGTRGWQSLSERAPLVQAAIISMIAVPDVAKADVTNDRKKAPFSADRPLRRRKRMCRPLPLRFEIRSWRYPASRSRRGGIRLAAGQKAKPRKARSGRKPHGSELGISKHGLPRGDRF